jgi:hypothetical protein
MYIFINFLIYELYPVFEDFIVTMKMPELI